MSNNYKITNLTNISICIPDLSINLHEKGDYAYADAESADTSHTLSGFKNNGWVKIEHVRRMNMPVWPFYRLNDVSKEKKSEHPKEITGNEPTDGTLNVLNDIKNLLTIIANNPINQMPLLQVGTNSVINPVVESKFKEAPNFIPTSIVPTDNVDVSIKQDKVEISRDNIDASADMLRNLRKNKTKIK